MCVQSGGVGRVRGGERALDLLQHRLQLAAHLNEAQERGVRVLHETEGRTWLGSGIALTRQLLLRVIRLPPHVPQRAVRLVLLVVRTCRRSIPIAVAVANRVCSIVKQRIIYLYSYYINYTRLECKTYNKIRLQKTHCTLPTSILSPSIWSPRP